MYRWANPEQTSIIRESDGASIPCDPANSDYADLVRNGAVIAAYAPPDASDISVTQWQAREALRLEGKLAAVEAAVAALGPTHEASVAWNHRARIRRNSPLIAALAPTLNLSAAEIDALFAKAAALVE